MGANCSRHPTSYDDALLAAIRDGEDETVRKSLSTLRLVAQPSKYYLWAASVSALHVASNEGHLGVVQALAEVVKPGPQASVREKQGFATFVNRSNSYGQTALMLACKTGHTEVVKYLLDVGADPLVADKVHSRTCLHYAAWNGWAECITVLLSESCRVRLYNGLVGGAHDAIVCDALGTARMVDMRSESGFTPLHFAVSASNASAVKALLEKGASLSAEVLQGSCYSIWPTQSTPLHIAAAKGSASVVRLLLQAQLNGPAGATDVRAMRDSNGKQPFDIARALQHVRIEYMLDPALPLRQAVNLHGSRSARAQGCAPLSVLAGKVVQLSLLGQLDFLAWQLRLRDGAGAAMPRSLKRQLMKSNKSRKGEMEKAAESSEAPAAASSAEGVESQVSTDSEDREAAGHAKPPQGPTSPEETSTLSELAEDSVAAEDQDLECESHPLDAATASEDDSGSTLAAKGCGNGGAHNECGVCLDRDTQLLIGECHHECCYDCAMALVKKTKLAKASIRCPFCRSVIGSFQLKDKSNQPVMLGGQSSFG